ncbi:AAA family ATPase, partial [Prevotella pallens]|uniref:AAA family ATPase n=2 Tax=Bacteria TaxID=2 RepID=UPI001CB3D2F3
MKPLSPSLPHIIAMVGAPGSGKTQFAVEFAKIFNSPVVSSRQFEVFTDNTKTISDATLSLLEEFLKTKQTVILDGSTDQRTNRMRINRLAREYGYKVLFVWVQTDPATAKHRWIKT